MRKTLKTILAAGVAGSLLFGAASAGAAESFTAAQKEELGQIIKQYLLENPEILDEAMSALEKKRADQAQAQQSRTIAEKASLLLNSPRQVVLGNPKGDVTVVEFFDYNCGYCKRAMPDMLALLEQDKNLRFVLKEFPVLGQGSVEAAHVATAVNKLAPEKYLDFHKKLLSARGEANKARAMEAAVAVGLDAAKIEAEMKSAEVQASLEEGFGLANGLGLTGTPSYVIGQQVIPGAIGMPKLKDRIAEVRGCLPKQC
ncbi:DsbA family protein [Methyloraptor flagellatus]|uniref:DsbA family protein n=1 Tax=Methyloraptor flagellatus TaxID=3162530 RepID=A0AAU7XCP4_9HYPH